MPWYRVEIPSSDIPDIRATGIMNQFARAYRDGGAPKEARVYHGKSPAEDHIYYFSPEAAILAVDLLREFGATACSGGPDLSSFRRVTL